MNKMDKGAGSMRGHPIQHMPDDAIVRHVRRVFNEHKRWKLPYSDEFVVYRDGQAFYPTGLRLREAAYGHHMAIELVGTCRQCGQSFEQACKVRPRLMVVLKCADCDPDELTATAYQPAASNVPDKV